MTSDLMVFELQKPDHAIKFIPQEWKDLPATTQQKVYKIPQSTMTIEESTLKGCVGFINLFKNGFIIPMWADTKLETLKTGEQLIFSPNQISKGSQHDSKLMWKGLYDGWSHYKLNSPWYIKCSEDVKFIQTECSWNDTAQKKNYHIVNGVVDFKYQTGTHINMWTKPENVLEFSMGTPMVHLIPLTDRKIKLNYHLVEGKDLMRHQLTFRNIYKQNKQINDEQQKRKCPFGFGK